MKITISAAAMAVLVAVGTAAPSVSEAANARHPYHRVNHANDRGNRTGDSAVERLNQQQLDAHRGQ